MKSLAYAAVPAPVRNTEHCPLDSDPPTAPGKEPPHVDANRSGFARAVPDAFFPQPMRRENRLPQHYRQSPRDSEFLFRAVRAFLPGQVPAWERSISMPPPLGRTKLPHAVHKICRASKPGNHTGTVVHRWANARHNALHRQNKELPGHAPTERPRG